MEKRGTSPPSPPLHPASSCGHLKWHCFNIIDRVACGYLSSVFFPTQYLLVRWDSINQCIIFTPINNNTNKNDYVVNSSSSFVNGFCFSPKLFVCVCVCVFSIVYISSKMPSGYNSDDVFAKFNLWYFLFKATNFIANFI